VRTFLDVADRIVEAGGVVAVHCKAGLGRTGTLIGAFLIWKYGFTANEAIAFMRIVRPGSVVGPQQQYMYLKQLEWAKWAAVDEMRKTQASNPVASIPVVTPVTPPAETDDEVDAMQTTPTHPTVPLPPVTPSRHVAAAAAKATSVVPPGQPRKTPNAKRRGSRRCSTCTRYSARRSEDQNCAFERNYGVRSKTDTGYTVYSRCRYHQESWNDSSPSSISSKTLTSRPQQDTSTRNNTHYLSCKGVGSGQYPTNTTSPCAQYQPTLFF